MNSDAADGSELKKHGGSKTGWVGKILEPGVNNSDDSDDDDSDDDAPGMTPEDLGMTEGGGKGRAKASHHVTWLIASTSTEAQVRRLFFISVRAIRLTSCFDHRRSYRSG